MSGIEGFQSEIKSEVTAIIRLDARIYSREALLRTAYWYSGTAYIQIPEFSDSGIIVEITLKQQAPSLKDPKPLSIDRFVGEFCNSLLDFELRRQVEVETASIRQLILAKAFSESGVLEDNPVGTISDPVEAKNPTGLVQLLNSSNLPLK